VSFDTDTIDYPHYPRQWEHGAKVEFMVHDLARRGVGLHISAPPLFRAMWKIGLQVPPPLFLRWWTYILVTGSALGVLWILIGSVMFVGFLLAGHVPKHPERLPLMILWCIGFGLVMGLCLLPFNAWRRHRLQLPAWKCYPPDPSVLCA
jgi:hypothetical protein